MQKAEKTIFLVLYWLFYLLVLCFGALCMPSGLGAALLFLAMFMTPRPIINRLNQMPWIRWVFLFLAYFYLRFIPDEDIRLGANHFAGKIQSYMDFWEKILEFFIK